MTVQRFAAVTTTAAAVAVGSVLTIRLGWHLRCCCLYR